MNYLSKGYKTFSMLNSAEHEISLLMNSKLLISTIVFFSLAEYERTTCIKAQKWPPTKLTHIAMNNSCVVPLTETGMEIGDGTKWGQRL